MDDDVKFILKMKIALLLALAAVLVVSYSLYTHPMPEKDCSKPYDYPICRRAYDVQPWMQPGLFYTSLYALLALFLIS